MSREIKFRAWDKEQNKWRYTSDSDKFHYFWQWVYNSLPGQETDETVTQYTGLKDKNRVEIYEGDILQGSNGVRKVPEDLAEVGYQLCEGFDYTNVEVIGNIHENPELLEQPNV